MPKKLRNVLAILLVLSLFFSGTVLAQVSPALRDPGGGGGSSLTKPIKTTEEVIRTIKIPQVKDVVEAQEKALTDGQQSLEEFSTKSFKSILAEGILLMSIGSVEMGPSGKPEFRAGASSITSELIASVYSNPPASAQSYVAYVMNSADIAQPAYAQGLGFSSLTPILSAWIVFRNIAYFFFVAIFVIIGFMIMFRQKISGQAVVTAQQAIPSIIISLVAVTFSYAIAGFLIEIMYLVMFLVVGIFGRNQDLFLNGNVFQIGSTIISNNTQTVAEVVGAFINDSLGGGIVSNALGVVGGVTAGLIFAAVILISIFRLLFILLKKYVAVIASVVLAPIILMVGAIPGKNTFGPWLKGIVGNLAVFPALLIALIISDVITGNFSGNVHAVQYGGFLPPYLGGVGTSGTASFLIGVGILLVLPDLVEKIAQLAGAGKGPLDELVSAASRNIIRGTDALPIAGAAVGGAYGGARALQSSIKIKQTSPQKLVRNLIEGTTEKDGDGNEIRYGGIAPRARQFFGYGQQARRTIDDIKDQRFLDPNRLDALLRQAANQRDSKDK